MEEIAKLLMDLILNCSKDPKSGFNDFKEKCGKIFCGKYMKGWVRDLKKVFDCVKSNPQHEQISLDACNRFVHQHILPQVVGNKVTWDAIKCALKEISQKGYKAFTDISVTNAMKVLTETTAILTKKELCAAGLLSSATAAAFGGIYLSYELYNLHKQKTEGAINEEEYNQEFRKSLAEYGGSVAGSGIAVVGIGMVSACPPVWLAIAGGAVVSFAIGKACRYLA